MSRTPPPARRQTGRPRRLTARGGTDRLAPRSSNDERRQGELKQIKHFVVIYEENHSFDNLYGGWEGVNGRANANAAHTTQVNQAGNAYACLKQDDVNLTSPPLSATCSDSTAGTTGGPFSSHFPNTPFQIDTYIAPAAKTCPAPTVFGPANGILDPNGLPGGCTTQPFNQPYSPGTAVTRRLPPLPATNVTIGDELTAAGVDWA